MASILAPMTRTLPYKNGSQTLSRVKNAVPPLHDHPIGCRCRKRGWYGPVSFDTPESHSTSCKREKPPCRGFPASGQDVIFSNDCSAPCVNYSFHRDSSSARRWIPLYRAQNNLVNPPVRQQRAVFSQAGRDSKARQYDILRMSFPCR